MSGLTGGVSIILRECLPYPALLLPQNKALLDVLGSMSLSRLYARFLKQITKLAQAIWCS